MNNGSRGQTFALPVVMLCIAIGTNAILATQHISAANAPSPDREARPNIILIYLDDADTDTLAIDLKATSGTAELYFPHVSQLARQGVWFDNFHVTTPVCGPSRACLLSGRYAHNTGIKVNRDRTLVGQGFSGGYPHFDLQQELGQWMRDAGYRTMFVGKFLHDGFEPDLAQGQRWSELKPSGWDEFHASMGSKYFDFYRMHNEQRTIALSLPGEYRTNAEFDNAMQLIDAHSQEHAGQPFFLCLAPLAPHEAESRIHADMIDAQWRNLWHSAAVPVAPDLNELDVSDKPQQIRRQPLLSPEALEKLDKDFRYRLLATKSADFKLGQLLAKLRELGQLDRTIIFLTSDHGYQLGHHRLVGKRAPYNRVTNVPLFVWGSGVASGVTASHLLANIDLAPTLVQLAGGAPPASVDGRSFASLLGAPASHDSSLWRTDLLIENWELAGDDIAIDIAIQDTAIQMTYNMLRTTTTVYIEWVDGEREYYDLLADPYQLDNQYAVLDQPMRDQLAARLRQLKNEPTVPQVARRVRLQGPTLPDSRVRSGSVVFCGIAEDHRGVAEVRIVIRDAQSQQFWNGQQWQDDRCELHAYLQSPGGIVTNWSYAFEPQLAAGQLISLLATARAYDAEKNCAPRPYGFRFEIAGAE